MDISQTRYHHLGWRVYLLFLLQKSQWFIINLLAVIILVTIIRTINLPETIPTAAPVYTFLVLVGALPITLLFGLLVAWIKYLAYEFCLDENSLKLRTGIIGVHIDAIPYRQMQDIDIERDALFRLFGISRLMILTAGTEDQGDPKNEAKGIIPALDKVIALQLQEELLKRANIEKTVQV